MSYGLTGQEMRCKMIDSMRLNQMLLEIEMSLSSGLPILVGQDLKEEESYVYRELAKEAYLMRAKGIAVEIPAEWPELVFTDSTRV